MEFITIFLASSIKNELKSVRLEVSDYIRRLNDACHLKGVYIRLFVCEEVSNAISVKGKQKEYDELIAQSDLFYVLVREHAGKYTLGEYEKALETYTGTGHPEIHCAFMEVPEKDKSVEDFEKKAVGDHSRILYFTQVEDLKKSIGDALSARVEELSKKGSIRNEPENRTGIFLAMPASELKEEQLELEDFVRCLNDEFISQEQYFYLSTHDDLVFSANENNDQDYFYIIFRTQSDEAIIRDFERAREQFAKTEGKRPKIYTYFQSLEEGIKASEGVQRFMTELSAELKHYYSRFSSIDSIKLNMLIELTREKISRDAITVKDGNVLINNKALLSVSDIPLFFNNDKLKKYKSELAELREQRNRLLAEYAADPEDDGLMTELSEAALKLNELTGKSRELEKNILDVFSVLAEYDRFGKPVTERAKEAGRYLEQGNYEAALKILRSNDQEKDLQHAQEIRKHTEDELMGLIHELRLRIKTLMAMGLKEGSVAEVYECFEKCTSIVQENYVDPGVVKEYLLFLVHQNDLDRGVKLSQWLLDYYKIYKNSDPSDRADVLSSLGRFHERNGSFSQTEECFCEEVGIRENLAEQKPSVKNQEQLSTSYNNLSMLYANNGRYKDAERMQNLSISALEKIEEAGADKLALAYHNMGFIKSLLHDYIGAVLYYRVAVIFMLEMTDEEADDSIKNRLAVFIMNLSDVYIEIEDYKQAEKLCREALSIQKELVRNNPAAYLLDFLGAYNQMGLICERTLRPDQARKNYLAAIETAEKNWKKLPKQYYTCVADSYRGAASISLYKKQYYRALKECRKAEELLSPLSEQGKWDRKDESLAAIKEIEADAMRRVGKNKEAEALYCESIECFRKLGEKDPEAYDRKLADAYKEAGDFYSDNALYEKAEEYYVSAVRLLEGNSYSDYESSLAETFYVYASMCKKQGRYEKAEGLFKKSIALLNKLAAENPLLYEDGLVNAWYLLGDMYFTEERYDEAEDAFANTVRVMENGKDNDPEKKKHLAVMYLNLADCCSKLHKEKKAEKYRSRAKTLSGSYL